MKLPRLTPLAAWSLIALGILLRLRQYLANRSLWLDEAMLALNILHKNLWGLFGKLDYDQGAPLGFLLIEKLAATLFGDGERALRLLPLLAGCASLVLFYFLARDILNFPGLLIALAILTFGRHAIYYSSEVKQYSLDSAIVLALFLLGARLFRPEKARGAYWILLIAGILAPWFSHPAIFALAAIGGLSVLQNIRRWPTLLATFGLGSAWLISFSILYLVNLRVLAQNRFLFDFWADFFMPLSWQTPAWIYSILKGALYNPGGLTTFVPRDNTFINNLLLTLPFILFVIGLLFLLRQNWRYGALFGLTMFAALTASALGKYPFGGRMILFLVPTFALLIGAGVNFIVERLGKKPGLAHGLSLLLAAFLLYTPIESAARIFISPRYPEHIRPAMTYLKNNLKPGDSLYVYSWAIPAFLYYADPNMDYIAGGFHANRPQDLLAEIHQFQGQPRVWILFSHVYENETYNEMDLLLEYLDEIGEKRRQFIEPGTSVYLYLYDLR